MPLHASPGRSAFLTLLALATASLPGCADPPLVRFTVSAGTHDRENIPICVNAELPDTVRPGASCTVRLADGSTVPAQITAQSLGSNAFATTGAKGWKGEIHFIVPTLAAGHTVECSALLSSATEAKDVAFHWLEPAEGHVDLLFGDRSVLRYEFPTFDESTPAAHDATSKVFHQLFDPSGKQLVTKGLGGLYPHHRGLFYGFNKVTYGDGKKCDIWHCKGAHQEHKAFVSAEAGPVLGRHRVAIDWCGQDNEVFAREERELTVYNTLGGELVEFRSLLTPVLPPVKLDGDPQHAGFHFRAAQEVAEKTKKQTYFLRPDGKGAEGETRNWPDQPEHVNLPWDAMGFVLGDKRFTVAYLDRAKNPKEARFSERDYGRIGSYFAAELASPDAPLVVAYRVWLQEGDITPDHAGALAADFDDPPTVTLK